MIFAAVESGCVMMEKLNEAFRNFGEAAGKVIKALMEILPSIFDTEIILAYHWAKEAHPEWVVILNRTKKKRIRKKYQDRILREYKKEGLKNGKTQNVWNDPEAAQNANGMSVETKQTVLRKEERKKQEMKVTVDVGAVIPRRAHKHDAGFDLCATKGGWIFPKSRKVFGTGFHASIPIGYVGLLTSKSGLMMEGITSRGTIDSGYNGEIRAVMFNHSWKFIRIRKNQKITQLVILPIITPELELVDDMEATERGTGGFGSTGKF